uniref:Digestive organ expansion factor homolog n=1 Tax=Rhodnius prolixus TaxID=13249 RepID=T1HCF5_RHOPR
MFRKQLKRKQLNLNVKTEELNSRKFRKRKQPSEKLNSKDLSTESDVSAQGDNVDSVRKVIIGEEDIVEEDAFGEDLIKKNLIIPGLLGCRTVRKAAALDEDTSIRKEHANLLEQNSFAELRTLPDVCPEFSWDKLHIKSQIIENVKEKSKLLNSGKSALQEELLIIASNYHDIYFPEETFENIEAIQFVYCVHAINHVIKARLKVLHHNSKLSKRVDVPEEFRDQGLVRPKVLILLPFKESAKRVVKMLSYILSGEKDNIANKKRFIDEYTGNEIIMPEKNPKPADYQLLFSGNTDDNFRIGLSVTRKWLKLYEDFYSSDIIIASPLGLRMLIGAENEKNRDFDFLSSIEILIMDQSQVFVMQNWEHVIHIMNHMHLQPTDSHGTDLSRVRMWALNGCTKYYMQSLIFSSHALPEISAFFTTKFLNYAGKVMVTNPVKTGSICQVAVHAPQVFHEVSTNSVLSAVDDRFEAFVSDILPQFKDPSMKHTLIFIPSYFDFVRLRNYFKKQEMKFVHICEYTEDFKKGKDIQEDSDIDRSINVIYTKYDIIQLASIVGSERATKMLASDKSVHMFMAD